MEYIYGLGRKLAEYRPGEGYKFLYVDHLNSTRAMSGANADAIAFRRDYFPYGEDLTVGGNDDTPYHYS